MSHALKQADVALGLELRRSMREGGGTPRESDSALNDASRALVQAMHEAHGEAWLGKINLYHGDEGKPCVWKWDGRIVHTFSAAFVLPARDEEVERLIIERATSRYCGTAADADAVHAIIERVEAAGGKLLFWS